MMMPTERLKIIFTKSARIEYYNTFFLHIQEVIEKFFRFARAFSVINKRNDIDASKSDQNILNKKSGIDKII